MKATPRRLILTVREQRAIRKQDPRSVTGLSVVLEQFWEIPFVIVSDFDIPQGN
jgi:hypothetical protein